jgi:hypothetical protein
MLTAPRAPALVSVLLRWLWRLYASKPSRVSGDGTGKLTFNGFRRSANQVETETPGIRIV